MPRRRCLRGHREDAGQRRAGDRDAEPVRGAAEQRVAPREPDEPAVRGADARERGLLAAVRGDLRRGAQQLDELAP